MTCKIKICGVTTPEDADMVATAGVDYIGLNFIKRSHRRLTLDVARTIAKTIDRRARVIAVLEDASQDTVADIIEGVQIDVLQFHGQESNAECTQYGLPFIKAMSVDHFNGLNNGEYSEAEYVLLDAMSAGKLGGTGKTIDWQTWPRHPKCALMLAGGLNPSNVSKAITLCKPHAVDVASGVEVKTGQKGKELVYEFIEAVRNAN